MAMSFGAAMRNVGELSRLLNHVRQIMEIAARMVEMGA
jgi:hypothetical protein